VLAERRRTDVCQRAVGDVWGRLLDDGHGSGIGAVLKRDIGG
jgi:hypothetical protein